MRIIPIIATAIAILLLSLMASFNQVKARGLSWQEVHYRAELISGLPAEVYWCKSAGPLSSVLVRSFHSVFEPFGAPRSFGTALVVMSVSLNMMLLLIALIYYRRLGIPVYLGLLGTSAIAWLMTQGNGTSTLAFDRSIETICFVLLGIVLTMSRDWLLFPLVLVAAFNRESALLLPVLYLSERWRVGQTREDSRQLYVRIGLCICLVAIISTGPIAGRIGTSLHEQDLRTIGMLLLMLGPMPLLAAFSFPDWPPVLRRPAILLLPIWSVFLWFHFEGESNLLLLPMTLIFVPGALLAVKQARAEREPASFSAHVA